MDEVLCQHSPHCRKRADDRCRRCGLALAAAHAPWVCCGRSPRRHVFASQAAARPPAPARRKGAA